MTTTATAASAGGGATDGLTRLQRRRLAASRSRPLSLGIQFCEQLPPTRAHLVSTTRVDSGERSRELLMAHLFGVCVCVCYLC